jgi:tetratricopeptide (TPR) repeat protein
LIDENGHDAAALNNRGAVNSRLENYDTALIDFDRAIQVSRDYTAPHIGRAQILFRRGDYAGAVASYDNASRMSARNQGVTPEIYAGKCAARAAARTELDAARRFCDRAVRNSRNAPWALAARGYFRVLQGDLDGAAADFSRAVERDALSAPALYGRGAVAVRQGQTDEGEADMARAMEMNRRQVSYYANAGLRP